MTVLFSTMQFLDSNLLHFLVLTVSDCRKRMKRLRNVWGVNILFYFFFSSPPSKNAYCLSQGGILNPSTGAWWFLHHLWFFSRPEIASFGGGAELGFSLLTNPDSSLDAAASLLLSRCEMCLSCLVPGISSNQDQVTIFRHKFSFRVYLNSSS